jgi:hypothetical protein
VIAILLVNLVVFGVLLAVAAALERSLSTPAIRFPIAVASLLLAMPGIAYAGYYLHLVAEPIALYRLRSVPGSELLAAGCGAIIGWSAWSDRLAARRLARPVRALALVVGVAVITVPHLKSIVRPLDPGLLRDHWSQGVCLQSTDATCGPSCAASLLHQWGLAGDEAALAAEAHTTATGTECWYLARALRRRGLTVDFVVQDPALPYPAPSIAGVRLGEAGHFIALLGFDETGSYVVGDPLTGRTVMTAAELRVGYAATGFFLALAPPSAP